MKEHKVAAADPRVLELQQALGRALGILRRRRGVSLREAGAGARVSPITFHLWEKGEMEPDSEHLRDALTALGVDFYDLQEVLDSLQNVTGPELQPITPEDEILLREIVEDLALLLKQRERGEEERGGKS
jgi:transcriptional regulator with XRE-family HTH domain